jgi:hypothetical protein
LAGGPDAAIDASAPIAAGSLLRAILVGRLKRALARFRGLFRR